MNPIEIFNQEKEERIKLYPDDKDWRDISNTWINKAFDQKYMYNFTWMGRPIIQLPVDMVAIHEIIWQIKPDLIIETGIAHGGSLIMSASMLALLDYCDAIENRKMLDPSKPCRKVLGIDIDIRKHNRDAINAHPMKHRIDMIEGSSIDPVTINQVKSYAANFSKILICLDSNHTHEHVLAELKAYAPLTTVESYCVVFDTIVEDMPKGSFPNRPWDKGNNPKTAVREYINFVNGQRNQNIENNIPIFEIDKNIENKLMLSVAPDGFLKRLE